ncbi:MAG: hypothetical protein HY013_14160 [Candidatus Solibacter usitatus]|nr:hypothetical protein [Candidatus Solibacter usitatus]
MERFLTFCLLILIAAGPGQAQLTTDQRLADFRNLADVYAKKYAFYEWKRDAIKFDALNLQPWLARVRSVQNDLDFYDLMAEYVASLNDAHDGYYLPSTFRATLGFTADLYDGKVLVDSVDRDRLAAADFPFEAGDEVVSVDGKSADALMDSFLKYSVAANTRSTRREAARLLSRRSQFYMPHAHEIGDTAAVAIKRQSGETATYNLPWKKDGTPVTALPGSPVVRTAPSQDRLARGTYPRLLPQVRNWMLPVLPSVLNIGARLPVFEMPADTFQRRLQTTDPIFSGILTVQALKIGYIRIPSFQLSFRQTDLIKREIAFYKDNSDGLILDLMRNPGGSPCQAEELLSYIMPNPFRVITQELRVNWTDVLDYMDELDYGRQFGYSDDEIAQLDMTLAAIQKAISEQRPRTEPLPICGSTLQRDPATDRTGANIAYTKPVMLLTDEFSASAAEVFAAAFQDNGRGKIFVWRTMGAGGGVTDFDAGVYTEGSVSVTISAGNRKAPVKTSDFPESPYIENIGVRPDIELDYMTKDNLLNKGKAFVEAFGNAVVEHVKASK